MNPLTLLWLIPLLPLSGALVLLLVGRQLERTRPAISGAIACATVLGSFVLSALSLAGLSAQPHHRFEVVVLQWMPGFPTLVGNGTLSTAPVDWGYLLDPLSAVMILIITGIGMLIHVYSTGYMARERGRYRFFAYLNLFIFFMLLLVLANNYVLLFAGWEGVGLCSYLLIGFYTRSHNAGIAANKAFWTNRVGDAALLIGILLLFSLTGSFRLGEVETFFAGQGAITESGFGLYSVAALLLLIGAAGKSAQFPLHIWLPDAMEGPTPVSALIHAATMVTAGVYLVARTSALYALTPSVSTILAALGGFTAIFAASIAIAQTDIKRVLAYSTISQLGYMFMALGAGAYWAAVFHLFTHAFFKALLFLGAGSVIHALHGQQDMRHMGGLRKRLPVTYTTMVVASLAIAGVPGLAGFFSKDEILWRLFSSPVGFKLVYTVGLVTALLTAFYMWRLIVLVFDGAPRFEESKPIHESPLAMTVPLIVLAMGTVVAGWIGVPRSWTVFGAPFRLFEVWLEPVFPGNEAGALEGTSGSTEMLLMAASVLAAVGGIYWAQRMFRNGPRPALHPALETHLMNRWYVDHVVDAVVVRGIALGGGSVLNGIDQRMVDGGVNNVGRWTRGLSKLSIFWDTYLVDGAVRLLSLLARVASVPVRLAQTGRLQSYGLVFAAALLLCMGFFLYRL